MKSVFLGLFLGGWGLSLKYNTFSFSISHQDSIKTVDMELCRMCGDEAVVDKLMGGKIKKSCLECGFVTDQIFEVDLKASKQFTKVGKVAM